MDQSYFEQNNKLWDSRVAVHLQSEFYDMEGFRQGKSSLTEIELEALGKEVAGRTMLHLQCHFGQDSLSWARMGAKVTGVDFSGKAIEAAKALNEELNLDAHFIQANVYDLPEMPEGEFDIVYTTYGAIPWLPDLEKWASIVSRFLKKGGTFYLAEFHPVFYLFNFENGKVEYGYFTGSQPYEEKVQGTYADQTSTIEETEFFWNHSFSEIMTPLLKQGLTLLEFKEFDFSPFNCFPNMEKREPGKYVWSKFGVRLPHIFSLKMVKR